MAFKNMHELSKPCSFNLILFFKKRKELLPKQITPNEL